MQEEKIIKEHFPCPDLIVFEGIDVAFSCGCFVINLDQMSSGSFVYTVAAGNFKYNHVLVRSLKSMPLENALLEVKEFLTKQQQAIALTKGEVMNLYDLLEKVSSGNLKEAEC